MNRRHFAPILALSAAVICVSACTESRPVAAVASKPSASASDQAAASYRALANRGEGPRVREITVREGRQLAAAWCIDLAASDKASAMAAINLEAPQLDALNVMFFAIEDVCPELRSKVDP